MDVQCVIQTRKAVYLPKYSPVTASWYPTRLPTGQYIYPFTMYCVLYDHATMSSIPKKKIIATKTIHLYPFRQKLYRPTFPSSHDTEVAIMALTLQPPVSHIFGFSFFINKLSTTF